MKGRSSAFEEKPCLVRKTYRSFSLPQRCVQPTRVIVHFSREINQALEGLLDIGCKLNLNLGDKNFTVEIYNQWNFSCISQGTSEPPQLPRFWNA